MTTKHWLFVIVGLLALFGVTSLLIAIFWILKYIVITATLMALAFVAGRLSKGRGPRE